MKKIYVEGYPQNNLGDDLFFQLLLSRYPKDMFFFNKANNSKILNSFKNVRLIDEEIKSIILHIKKFDAFLLIGGSMFQEVGTRRIWFKRWLILFIELLILKLNRKKIVFIGFNFGPYKSKVFLRLYKLLFSLVDYLSVRDEYTFNLLKENSRVHYYPDIVFSLNNDAFLSKYQRSSLAISVMDFGLNNPAQFVYEKFIVDVINGINPNIEVNLYGFQLSKEINDKLAIDRVNEKLRRKINIIQYDGSNMNDLIESYYCNSFALTTRFHSLVLSLKAQHKIISISYNVKVDNLQQALQLKNTFISLKQLKDKRTQIKVVDEINGFFSTHIDRKIQINNNPEFNFEKDAKKHFEYIDNMLGKK